MTCVRCHKVDGHYPEPLTTRYVAVMQNSPTWTLVVDGTPYVIDWGLGVYISKNAEALSPNGFGEYDLPGAAAPVRIEFGRPDSWSLTRND